MDARIPLGFRAEQPELYTPADAQRKRLSLQQMAQQTRALDMRAREDEEKLRRMNEDREDEGFIQQAFTDTGGDHEKMRAAIAPKVRFRNLQRWDNDHLQAQRAALSMANEERIATKLKNDLAGGEVAALLAMPYEQRKVELPAALERLKKNQIDTIPDFDPTDANLKAAAARVGYLGTLLSHAEKKALEEKRVAEEKRAKEQTERIDADEKRKAKQTKLEDAARGHLGVTSATQHLDWLKSLDPEIAPLYKNLTNYDANTRRAIQQMGMTSVQREQANQRDEAAEQRAQYQRDSLDLREQIANQNAGLRAAYNEILRTRGAGGRTLTPGQLQVEQRNIDALENGTGTKEKPGLNALRMRLGQQLKSGKNEKGEAFKDKAGKITDQAEHDRIVSELQAVNDNLQNVQFRKAKLYNIGTPDPQDVAAADEGAEIETAEGAVWTKKGGVAFFARMGGAGQQPAPAAPKSGAPKPAAAPKLAAAPPTGGAATGPVFLKLPNGKFAKFPNEQQRDAWMKSQGLQLAQQ
jgi:hypothetical protein